MKVYAIYRVHGDGDSYPCFVLQCIAANHNAVSRIITETRIEYGDYEANEPAHDSMNEHNGYVYYGSCKDCNGMMEHGAFGGYVVEEIEVEE